MRELLVELLIFIVQLDVAIELVKGVNVVDSQMMPLINGLL